MCSDYSKIENLISFNVIFSALVDGNDPLSQSPEYIIEKYDTFIGFKPTVEHKIYTPDNMTDFFNKYWKIWKPNNSLLTDKKFKNILMYLYSIKNNRDFLKIFDNFEEYIGELKNISDFTKTSLHPSLKSFVESILKSNKEDIKTILRDLKIKKIVL